MRSTGVDFEEAFQRLHDPALVIEASFQQLVAWNGSAKQLLGYADGELGGLTLEALVAPRLQALYRGALQRQIILATNGATPRAELELPIVRRGGEEIVVELALTGLTGRGRNEPHVLVVLRDASERRQATLQMRVQDVQRQQLRGRNARLLQGLMERTAQIKAANEQLRAQMRELELAAEERVRLASEQAARVEAEKAHERTELLYRQAQEAIQRDQRSLALVSMLLESAPVGLAFFDRELRVTKVNRELTEITGRHSGIYYGRTPRELDPKMADLIEPHLRGVLETGKPIVDLQVTGHIAAAPGVQRNWQASYYPVRLESGEVVGVGAVIADVTERVRSEAELRDREQRYRELFDEAPVGYHEVDVEGRIVRVNRTELAMLGYREEELVGRPVWEITADPEHTQRTFAKWLTGGAGSEPVERSYRRKDGSILQARARVRALRREDGKIAGMRVIVEDITEEKRTEAALQESEARYRELFDDAPVGYHEVDIEGRIVRVNRTELAMLGYTEAELLGRYIWELMAEREAARENFREKIDDGEPDHAVVRTLVRQDGSGLSALLEGRAIRDSEGRVIGRRATIQDVSARRQAEVSLQKSEARYRELFDEAPVGYHELDLEGRIARVNRTELDLLGYREKELVGRHIWEISEDPELSRKTFESWMAGVDRERSFQRAFRRKDGTLITVRTRGRLLRGEDGVVAGIRVIVEDISDEMRAEAARRESEARYRELFDEAPVGYHEVDLEGRIVRVNRTELKMLGYTESELLGRHAWEIVTEQDESRQRVQSHLSQPAPIHSVERTLIRKDGGHVRASMDFRQLRDPDGKIVGVRTTVQDLRERLRNQRRRLRRVRSALRRSRPSKGRRRGSRPTLPC
ncbi:MAG: PAS domain S-box protein [Chloroflexi bacterium]|nr:PAS domain S-box protein [Chloroflexota bacterium]